MKIHPTCFLNACYRSHCEQFIHACFIKKFDLVIFLLRCHKSVFWWTDRLLSGDVDFPNQLVCTFLTIDCKLAFRSASNQTKTIGKSTAYTFLSFTIIHFTLVNVFLITEEEKNPCFSFIVTVNIQKWPIDSI